MNPTEAMRERRMETTTKKALIDRIATSTNQKRNTVKEIVQEFLDQVVAEIGRGNRLEFRDFGVFEIRDRAQRTAQNPKTMAPVVVPARRTVKFKMGREMRALLDKAPPDGPPSRGARAKASSQVDVKPRGRAKVGV
jgi:integration host factor subunit beta